MSDKTISNETLADIQRSINSRWGSSEYGPAFLDRTDPQRDAHHAALHIVKAAGKLAGALDDLDHARYVMLTAAEVRVAAANALADLVICAARVASQWPAHDGPIDLAEAVTRRIAEKFP